MFNPADINWVIEKGQVFDKDNTRANFIGLVQDIQVVDPYHISVKIQMQTHILNDEEYLTLQEEFESRIAAGKCPVCGRQVSTQDLTEAKNNVPSKEVHWKDQIMIRICESHPNKDYKGRPITNKWKDF